MIFEYRLNRVKNMILTDNPINILSRALSITLILASLAACSTNPVTGKRELNFISTYQQIQIGEQQYGPSQQSQGGEYYLDPELNAYIQDVGNRLVAASKQVSPLAPDLPYEFVVLNNDVPNAWALPGGKIAINRGLLVHLDDEAELAAVLGHEIVHAASAHGAAQMSRGQLLGLGTQVAGIAASNSKYSNILNMGTQLGAGAWNAKYGRDDELESDEYGMRYMSAAGYDPKGAVDLQRTFVRLSEGRRQDFITGLFASHPPSQSRVDKNIEHAKTLPAGGKRYRERYQAAIRKLRLDKPAYASQTKAIAALKEQQPDQALQHLDRAVELLPAEAAFWELRGHAWQMKDNQKKAEQAFSTAVKKNPNYFRHWLARGMLYHSQNKTSKAESDLTQSQTLLPTPTASYYLGDIAEQRGDINTALNYFKQVAQSGGELGKEARNRIVPYELSSAPDKYIASGIQIDNRGQIYVAVQNKSGIQVNNIRVQLIDRASGRSKTYSIVGTLGHQQTAQTATGVIADPANFQVSVIAASAVK